MTMTSSMRRVVSVVGVALLLSQAVGVHSQELGTDEAEILWDTWGVPHIFADNLPAAVYANGYVQAALHGNLLMQLYAVARGRTAEYFGPDAAAVDANTWAFEVPVLGERVHERLTEQELTLNAAFAAGFTDYILTHTDEFDAPRLQVLPITALDVTKYEYYQTVQFLFGSSRTATLGDDTELLEVHDISERMKKSAGSTNLKWSDELVYAHDLDYSHAFGLDHRDPRTDLEGSNTWAINGNKSDGNGAKFLMNPHLSYSGLQRWTEVQITVASEEFNIYGAGFVGNVLPAMAFNDHLGWAHTVNRVQDYVTYKVPLVNDTHYRYNGEDLALESETYSYQIRVGTGAEDLVTTQLVVERTVHGPVFDKSADYVLASRWGGLDNTNLFEQRINMMRATNLGEFREAMNANQFGIFHTCGATKDGDIFNYFNGFVPKRDESLGDWLYWAEPVDGSIDATFFTEIHAFEDLPSIENPASNFVQNTNEPPWTMTLPLAEELDPSNFPSYMSLPPYMFSRSQTSTRLMMENDNISFDELVELKHSTRHELAYHTIDELVAAGREAEDLSAEMQDALDVLEAWDRNLNADSVGAFLFLQWVRFAADDPRNEASILKNEGSSADFLFSTPWSIDSPLDTPRDLSNATRALDALAEALVFLAEGLTNLSPVDIRTPYGEIFRLQDPNSTAPGATLPGHGGDETFRNSQWQFDADFDSATPSFRGDGWVGVVEFTPSGPRAKVLLGYGNGSQGKHVNDQYGLYANKELRDVWRDYSTIVDQHLESRVTLSYSTSESQSDDSESESSSTSTAAVAGIAGAGVVGIIGGIAVFKKRRRSKPKGEATSAPPSLQSRQVDVDIDVRACD